MLTRINASYTEALLVIEKGTPTIMPEYYSLQFTLFVIISLIIYYLSGKKSLNLQWIILLISSLVYYSFTGVYYLIFILITSFSIWITSITIDHTNQEYLQKKKSLSDRNERRLLKSRHQKRKRICLIACLILCLGLLAAFKYVPSSLRPIKGLLIPLGISFYTFQSVSYLVDVYNQKYHAEKSFFRLLLFISWFPQLVEGPINRYDSLAPQLFQQREKVNWDLFQRGLLQIGYGFFKKLAIANLLSEVISGSLDSVTGSIPGSVVVASILLYSAQQYADFSGGIDIVLGVSKLYGIQMSPNFRQPYFSVSLADFWRRWHITLGAWMRDYVFYPLALSRPIQKLGTRSGKRFGKKIGTELAAGLVNIIVFLLVGIWHGIESHYILWGLYNGIVIAVSSLLQPTFHQLSLKLKMNTEGRGFHIFRVVRTFIIVNIGWYFDRIVNLKDCMICFRNTFAHFQIPSLLPFFQTYGVVRFAIVAIACILVFFVSADKEHGKDVVSVVRGQHALVRYSLLTVCPLLILYSCSIVNHPVGFMYANF